MTVWAYIEMWSFSKQEKYIWKQRAAGKGAGKIQRDINSFQNSKSLSLPEVQHVPAFFKYLLRLILRCSYVFQELETLKITAEFSGLHLLEAPAQRGRHGGVPTDVWAASAHSQGKTAQKNRTAITTTASLNHNKVQRAS